MAMQSIFEFIDYRKFLDAFYQEQKKKFRNFSYRYFCRKAGINSPSFLKHVIDGKRNLTRAVIEKFCIALKLAPKEAVYFRNLVLFNQAKTSSEKQEHYAVLRSMAGRVKESVLGADAYDYFSNWFTPVIRELVCLCDFKEDFQSLASMVHPAILPSEAKAAVKLVVKLNLVERQTDGRYRQTNSAIVADDTVTSMAVRSFTKSMLGHSQTALDTFDKNHRHISGITMSVSRETYSVLCAEIEAFKDRVKLIVNQDKNSSRIYQMNLSLFPVSEELTNSRDEKGDTP
jgi:uncharacterized protein (TIGR02147 family)